MDPTVEQIRSLIEFINRAWKSGHADRCYVAGLGDSRAYLIRAGRAEQLTVDHSLAHELVRKGALTPEEARHSPLVHVLQRFLGCAGTSEGAEVRPFTPAATN